MVAAFMSISIYFLLLSMADSASHQAGLLNISHAILMNSGHHNLSSFILPLFSVPTSNSSSFLINALTKQPNAASATVSRATFSYNDVTLMTEVTVGNPPQRQKMVLDTGSELSWLQCIQSFNPLLSSSYSTIPCTSPICTKQTFNFPLPTICDTNRLCQFIYPYADGTSVQGNLGTDTITLPAQSKPQNFPTLDASKTELKIPNFVFGCNILAPLSDTPGLMGLGRGALSFVSQLPQNKFSYCIVDPVTRPNSPGVLLLGDSPFYKYLHYTPLYTVSIPLPYFNRVAYTVRIRGIKVGKSRVAIPKSVFLPDHTGAGQTMIDSGTQFSFLVGEAYTPLREAFLGRNQRIFNQTDSFVFQGAFDLCSSQPESSSFPEVSPVTLLFDSRAHVKLQSHQLLYQLPKALVQNGESVYCFTFGNSDLVGIAANIIGNYHQQNLWVEYDLQRSRIGFARADCRIS